MHESPLKQKYRQQCHKGGEIKYLLALNVTLQTYQRHLTHITVNSRRGGVAVGRGGVVFLKTIFTVAGILTSENA